MLHFDGHTQSIKKVMFQMKSGEYFEKDNIYKFWLWNLYFHVIYLCKRMYNPQPSFILQI